MILHLGHGSIGQHNTEKFLSLFSQILEGNIFLFQFFQALAIAIDSFAVFQTLKMKIALNEYKHTLSLSSVGSLMIFLLPLILTLVLGLALL